MIDTLLENYLNFRKRTRIQQELELKTKYVFSNVITEVHCIRCKITTNSFNIVYTRIKNFRVELVADH